MRTRLPRAEREQQTLDAARALFAERGFAAVTMDDVASAVGVTKPLLYTYFGNKDRLYLACMDPAADALERTVLEAVQRADGPVEALRLGVHAFFGFVDRDRDAWRVIFDESLPSGTVAAQVLARRERLVGLVAQTLIARLPAGAAPEVQALSTALMGAAEALGRWWLQTDAMPARTAAELLISTVEPGLRARTRTPGDSK